VTHDLDMLLSIVDHAIALGDGKVIGDGPVDELRASSHPWLKQYFTGHA
jgi:phospholipid/cholesterol/gamma-HCH transport system ATP-binding protein